MWKFHFLLFTQKGKNFELQFFKNNVQKKKKLESGLYEALNGPNKAGLTSNAISKYWL
jgi:hypothetical protein